MSTDHGQSVTSIATPVIFLTILADPNHPGRLLGSSTGGIYASDDGGVTWTAKTLGLVSNAALLTPDWANGFLYSVLSTNSIVRITADLQTTTPIGPPAVGYVGGIAVGNGHVYAAVLGTHDVYVTKLDPSGSVVYSTYFGGSADDNATAMAVDQAGNVYVTGSTSSLDFPVTKGAYASQGLSFLFRLNPDGSLGYSTYFAPSTIPSSIAVDAAGSAYLAGSTQGNLPVTPGAYQTACNCASFSTGFLEVIVEGGFATKFDSTGSSLLYSTYIGGTFELESVVNAFAVAPDETAYVAGPNGIFHLNATGTALLSSAQGPINASVMTVAPDGSLYLAGAPSNNSQQPFQATAGAFQSASLLRPILPGQAISTPGTAIARMDAQLANTLAATYFGSAYNQIEVMTLDSAGNLYVAGATGPQGLPARTPLQGGFAPSTGFMSELTGDLTTLLFSSYLGDNEYFTVGGVAASPNGSVIIGGATGQPGAAGLGPMNIYVNDLTLAPPPALRVDAVDNAASLLDTPLSTGETIVVHGAGFGSDAQLTIGADVVPAISMTSTSITAVVPQTVPNAAAQVTVRSGGVGSNAVVVPVAAAAPAIFSQNGSGYGQGYVLNKDGTLNTPSNPAAPGDRITIFATGVGPVSFTQGYAVTEFPVSVYIGGVYADGVAAVMGPVNGLPGSVYQITVTIPNPATFKFPPLVGVMMQINRVNSQSGIAISISQ